MSQVIVLGWDALDLELIERYGLSDAFGEYDRTIETYVNPVTDEPHTKELWPTMITGLHPDDHGITAADNSDGITWDNDLLNAASTAANGVVPHSLLAYIGERLRDRGAALDAKRPEYYTDKSIETIFDRHGGRPISIPNYETGYDRAHELDANRDRVWAELQVDRSGDVFTPDLDVATIYRILGRELGKRVGQTISAIQQGEPIVWTWFGCLDTAGHMAPAVSAPIAEDWYRLAARVTEFIRQQAAPETTVLAVSDHGLQDANHTQYATLCTDCRDATLSIDTIYDIAPWIDSQQPSAGSTLGTVSEDGRREVHNQLQELGYV